MNPNVPDATEITALIAGAKIKAVETHDHEAGYMLRDLADALEALSTPKPEPEVTGDYRKARGILKGKLTTDELPEVTVRRLRDGGEAPITDDEIPGTAEDKQFIKTWTPAVKRGWMPGWPALHLFSAPPMIPEGHPNDPTHERRCNKPSMPKMSCICSQAWLSTHPNNHSSR